jgi:hypothetical protein
MALRQPLDAETRAKLAELVKIMPEREARGVVGDIASETLARALGGLPIQRGSAELIRTGLARQEGKAA